ncbi:MAG: translational GTPase TypA [Clostridiales bacterium]
MSKIENIRNIAIIAHVDHGKTTLVDVMLKQSGIFRKNERVEERVMDSNDLERERGITILSKNTAIKYYDTKINIIDTPGHADFGGEVERVLKMVDGVLLVVDSREGPMPQTRFVLKKALAFNLKPIVVINKIDRPDARPNEVIDEVLDLFIDLEANDEQLEFPVIFASAKEGTSYKDIDKPEGNLKSLFETVVNEIPKPKGDLDAPLQLLISNIAFDEYVGRTAIGRIERGSVKIGQQAIICKDGNKNRNSKISNLYTFDGLKRIAVESASVGDIVVLSGISDISIGETVCDVSTPEALPFLKVDEPTITMNFRVNDSPFAGKEGNFVTSRHLRGRLYKEVETNLSLKVEDTDSSDEFKVSGRGELHLSILIETMRREGYEFQVSKPKVILKEIDGVLSEPVEEVTIDAPDEFIGAIIEKLGSRKGEINNIVSNSKGHSRLEFKIPSRGLIGFRTEFLTDTKGNGIINTIFFGYKPFYGEISTRYRGSIVVWQNGESVVYGLYNAQERGTLFIQPGVKVYEGMIVGENSRLEDIVVNVCKKKHITNIRSSSSDDAQRLNTPANMSLEKSLEFISDDELVEVTPKSIRLRKMILDTDKRAKIRKIV